MQRKRGKMSQVVEQIWMKVQGVGDGAGGGNERWREINRKK
jgi:hypothetical protein